MKADGLIVASPYKYVYEDFKHVPGVPVHYSHGLGLPNLHGLQRPAFWTSTAHAARLKRQMDIPFIAPGPYFLDYLPSNLKGRKVTTISLGGLRNSTAMSDEKLHWVKLAEMKDDRLPAQRCFIRDFVLEAESWGAPPETMVQICETNLTITAEYRCIVLDSEVKSAMPYMKLGDVWNIDADQRYWQEDYYAKLFAQYVVDYMYSHQPASYTLDVAQVFDPLDSQYSAPEMWVVMEANPIWSSAIYGVHPSTAHEAILAGVDYSHESKFMWIPDPWLDKKAQMKVELKPE